MNLTLSKPLMNFFDDVKNDFNLKTRSKARKKIKSLSF